MLILMIMKPKTIFININKNINSMNINKIYINKTHHY